MPLVLASRILEAYEKDDFIGALVYGPHRIGKSTYAALVLHEIYQDWDEVLKHMLFDIRDVIRTLRDAQKHHQKIPALVWDDCGVHANKMLYFSNRRLVQSLQQMLDVVGLTVSGFIFTTPSPANVLRVLRGYEFYRIKVVKRDEYNGRVAIGYQQSLLPSGMRIIRRKFRDNFQAILPDDVWKEYVKQRQKYLNFALKELEKVVK